MRYGDDDGLAGWLAGNWVGNAAAACGSPRLAAASGFASADNYPSNAAGVNLASINLMHVPSHRPPTTCT